MLSGASTEGHELVMLTLKKKNPKALSCELLEPKPSINSADAGPCVHNAPGVKLHLSFPSPLKCLKSRIQILHLGTP